MPQNQDPSNEQPHEAVIPLGEGPDHVASPPLDGSVPDAPAVEENVQVDRLEAEPMTTPIVVNATEPDPDTSQTGSFDVVRIDADSTDEKAEKTTALEGPASIIADGEAIIAPQVDQAGNGNPQSPNAAIPHSQAADVEAQANFDDKTSMAGRWRQRLGGKKDEHDGSTVGADPSSTESDRPSAATTNLQAIRSFFDPGFGGVDLRWMRRTVGCAAVLVLALLLANQAGLALIVASAVVPILIVLLLTAHDLYERESPMLLLGVGIAGGVAGILIGSIASWIVRSQWFDEGHLNFGAGGFGGKFAQDNAPLVVWFVVGLLLPAATVAGLAAAPLLMRRWPQFANEVMDGMILAGSSAAGLAIGLSATFWWPMIYGDAPLMDVSEWTLTIAGQVLLRPLVITLSGALIGAGVWRYMLHLRGSVALVLPAAGGVFGIMVLSLGSLALQPSGIWAEFLFTLVLALLVFAAYRKALESAIETDAAAMGEKGERMICPHCHLITPIGGYCGRCGKPLDVVTPVEMA